MGVRLEKMKVRLFLLLTLVSHVVSDVISNRMDYNSTDYSEQAVLLAIRFFGKTRTSG